MDILVNNATRQFSKDSILDIATAQFDETFKTIVYAMFWITKAAIPFFRPGATIINTASVNAYDPGENIIDYAATKRCNYDLHQRAGEAARGERYRVNAVAPGPF